MPRCGRCSPPADAVVLGDSVNIAARLEQAAAPGEVLIGEATYRLVAGAVAAEPVEPIAAKGKAEPLTAYRLSEVSDAGPVPRRSESVLVGREAELALLEAEFDAVESRLQVGHGRGRAGVGKSRLVAELFERVGGRARVARGACLSYGEGITFWAIAQIVRELPGSATMTREAAASNRTAARSSRREPRPPTRLRARSRASWRPPHQSARSSCWSTTSIGPSPPCSTRSERLPAMIGAAPVLVLCLARPELIESRPEWPVTVALEPLGPAEVDALLERLAAPAETRVRLALAAAGNPLYAEELVAWVREGGDVDDLPTSLNALLGARLDRLEGRERAALERGAIEGELFHHGAVVELSGNKPRLPRRSTGSPARI